MNIEHEYDKNLEELKVTITISKRTLASQKIVVVREKDAITVAENILSEMKKKYKSIKVLSGARLHSENKLSGTWIFKLETERTEQPKKTLETKKFSKKPNIRKKVDLVTISEDKQFEE